MASHASQTMPTLERLLIKSVRTALRPESLTHWEEVLMDRSTRSQRLLFGHGALILLFGFVTGFGFLFFLLGEFALWPIPGKIEIQLPGTYDAWRMAHMEGVINGFGLWLFGLVLPLVPVSGRMRTRLTWGAIVSAWTIVLAAAIDPLFPDARGLAFGGNAANTIAFLFFYVGILAVIGVVATIAFRCLWRPVEGEAHSDASVDA